jgi:hydroxymethylpyrimidine/phosphomethylpyrimidine kinase
MTPPRILAIAGSDSSGGAGIQADIKTITMLGGYAMTAITAVTAQNTLGVTSVEALSAELVAAQIDASLSDIGADAVKIGMLGSPPIGSKQPGCRWCSTRSWSRPAARFLPTPRRSPRSSG